MELDFGKTLDLEVIGSIMLNKSSAGTSKTRTNGDTWSVSDLISAEVGQASGGTRAWPGGGQILTKIAKKNDFRSLFLVGKNKMGG